MLIGHLGWVCPRRPGRGAACATGHQARPRSPRPFARTRQRNTLAIACAGALAARAEWPAQAFYQKAESQAALALLHGLLRIRELSFLPDEFLSGANSVYVVSPSDAATDGAPLVVGLVEELRLTALRISGPAAECCTFRDQLIALFVIPDSSSEVRWAPPNTALATAETRPRACSGVLSGSRIDWQVPAWPFPAPRRIESGTWCWWPGTGRRPGPRR